MSHYNYSTCNNITHKTLKSFKKLMHSILRDFNNTVYFCALTALEGNYHDRKHYVLFKDRIHKVKPYAFYYIDLYVKDFVL